MESTINNGIISFLGTNSGPWKVLSMQTISGVPMEMAPYLSISREAITSAEQEESRWILRAFISNLRYTAKTEKNILEQHSRGLALLEFNHAALIPIKKTQEWWALAQDERRKIFEEDSRHIEKSIKYLPVISRQLHHSKDLGETFDFLTWFEFSSEHDDAFDELCNILRKTEEWKYVNREVDIRLEKSEGH